MLKITFLQKNKIYRQIQIFRTKNAKQGDFSKNRHTLGGSCDKSHTPPSHRECANLQTKRRTRNERGVIVNREFGIESYSSSGSATKIRPQYSQTIIFLPRRTSAWRWGGMRL